MKKRYIALSVVAGLIVIGAIAGGNDGAPSSTKAEAAAPPITVTAAEISKAFQENEAKAKLAYDGRSLKVTGQVKEIDLSIGDTPVIRLKGAGDQYGMGVNKDGKMTDVALSGIANEAAAEITKGVQMTFNCSGVTEVMGSAQISDCSIAE